MRVDITFACRNAQPENRPMWRMPIRWIGPNWIKSDRIESIRSHPKPTQLSKSLECDSQQSRSQGDYFTVWWLVDVTIKWPCLWYITASVASALDIRLVARVRSLLRLAQKLRNILAPPESNAIASIPRHFPIRWLVGSSWVQLGWVWLGWVGLSWAEFGWAELSWDVSRLRCQGSQWSKLSSTQT